MKLSVTQVYATVMITTKSVSSGTQAASCPGGSHDGPALPLLSQVPALESVFGWVAAWHQKPALAPAAADAVASRHCLWTGVSVKRRFGLLLVCGVLLAACSTGSAASSSPPPGVALGGTFTDDSFQASDYHGNACAIFESGTWQVQVKSGGSTTVAVVMFTDTAVADAPGSGPGGPVYGLCRGSWSVSVPKSADYVITAISSGDDGDSQLPGSVVVPASYGGVDIQLGDDYGEELTG
jgi:hypothetical protein